MSMSKERRFDRIRAELAKKSVIDGDEIAALLTVSRATIRRDLDELEAKGVLRRTHGGAVLAEASLELPYYSKLDTFAQEKREIAVAVASRLPEGAVLGCTGGTTVMYAIRAFRGVRATVVTNAVNIAMELATAEGIEVVVTGGTLRPRSFELVGHLVDRTLEAFNLDIALLGVDGISAERGISTYTISEAHAASLYIAQAKEVWVLADHSKAEKVAPALIAPLGRIHRLFTDRGLSEELRRRYEAAGAEVIVAEA